MPFALRALIVSALVVHAQPAHADGWDLSVFGGVAFPTYEQQFVVRAPAVPPLPGFVIRPDGDLTIDAKGGTVFGAALAKEFGGVIGLEARFDSTAIDLRTSGVRYTLAYGPVPIVGTLNGSLAVAPGALDTDRLSLLSLNLRLRTPGPVSLVASGGVSYLPRFNVSGDTSVQLTVNGLPSLDSSTRLRLVVSPTESNHRFGVNGGVGLRVKVAPGLSVFGEARGFYFKEYDLSVDVDDPRLAALVGELEQPRFKPIIVNVVGGLVFSF